MSITKACIINNKTVELDFDGNIKLNTSEDTSHYIAMLSLKRVIRFIKNIQISY